jgi:hypothetical protein
VFAKRSDFGQNLEEDIEGRKLRQARDAHGDNDVSSGNGLAGFAFAKRNGKKIFVKRNNAQMRPFAGKFNLI